ncbi:DUF6266 family protein, partial [Pedobacter gandavensis]|uniref:DUF6266 family protein n=1 Tax=Pedobacter gandavensis TaxID=2679963 RepID=UPI00292F3DDA
MAIASHGPQGHYSGKVGNLVFYMLNGQPIVRLIGRKGKPTILQKANYQKMEVTMKLLRNMGSFIKLGFGLQAKGTVHNAHNLATSYNKKQALKGEYPNISIDYSKVLLSQGKMPATRDLKITKLEDGLEISWDPTQTDELDFNDSVMVMIYRPERGGAREYLNIARREEGKCFIPMYEGLLKEQMEPYIAFISADGERVSDSVYLGNLNGSTETHEDKHVQRKYQDVKERFDQVEGSYLSQIKNNYDQRPKDKAFKVL